MFRENAKQPRSTGPGAVVFQVIPDLIGDPFSRRQDG